MKMIIVTQCCCGCTVRTGSLIIGVLFGLSAIAEFVYEMTLLGPDAEVKHHQHGLAQTDDKEDTAFMSKGEIVASALVNILIFVACVSLIYGVLKERLQFIFVWIVTYSVYCGIVVLYILQVIITVMVHTEYVKQLWEVPLFLILLALSVYCVIVVNSHYRNLKDGVTLPPRPPLIIAV